MREIKFRAMVNPEMFEKPGWIYWSVFKDCMCDLVIYEKLLRPTLGQFTGLKDCNGVDSFGGDILNDIMINGSITRGKIIFENGCFMVEQIGAEHQTDYSHNHIHKTKIIGNIYENPELLK